MPTNKRLTLAERQSIETLLSENKSIRYIAGSLNKSPSTISREINKHSITKKAKGNDCLIKSDCARKKLCNSACNKPCSKCNLCRNHCNDYVPIVCSKKQAHPLNLCNHCFKKGLCHYTIRLYDAGKAHKQYKSTLKGMREGFDLTYEELCYINNLISPLILKGQSPYHIKQTLGSRLPVSEATLRRLIDKGELDARNIDLRNKVKRKERKKHRTMHNEDISMSKVGHLYSDYLAYIAENDVSVVQMDCVEGTREEECVLLTLHFPAFHFQLAFTMPYHTSQCVVEIFDRLENTLGTQLFSSLFGVILTDNGHEFSNLTAMEKSVNGGQRTKVFYCEPNRSDEKGSCENNHRLLRYVIPKGTNLTQFSQEDITLMMNHINSYSRKILLGRCPFDMVMAVFPNRFFKQLGLELIPPQDVLLTPALLRKHH